MDEKQRAPLCVLSPCGENLFFSVMAGLILRRRHRDEFLHVDWSEKRQIRSRSRTQAECGMWIRCAEERVFSWRSRTHINGNKKQQATGEMLITKYWTHGIGVGGAEPSASRQAEN
ncbi:hypothetical protein BDW69DRAFT_156951 [Aspergillus filifer]